MRQALLQNSADEDLGAERACHSPPATQLGTGSPGQCLVPPVLPAPTQTGPCREPGRRAVKADGELGRPSGDDPGSGPLGTTATDEEATNQEPSGETPAGPLRGSGGGKGAGGRESSAEPGRAGGGAGPGRGRGGDRVDSQIQELTDRLRVEHRGGPSRASSAVPGPPESSQRPSFNSCSPHKRRTS